MQLGLKLKRRPEFIFSGRPGAGPGYGDRGCSGRCASELVKDGWREAACSAGEEAQDQGRHVGVASADGVNRRGFHCRDAEGDGGCGEQWLQTFACEGEF